ncbi:hypothetical protein AHAS_Ahas07G0102800 [Arachis hypogaea]
MGISHFVATNGRDGYHKGDARCDPGNQTHDSADFDIMNEDSDEAASGYGDVLGMVHLMPQFHGISDAAKAHMESMHSYGLPTSKIVGYMSGIAGDKRMKMPSLPSLCFPTVFIQSFLLLSMASLSKGFTVVSGYLPSSQWKCSTHPVTARLSICRFSIRPE